MLAIKKKNHSFQIGKFQFDPNVTGGPVPSITSSCVCRCLRVYTAVMQTCTHKDGHMTCFISKENKRCLVHANW